MKWLLAHWRPILGVVLSIAAFSVILVLAFLTGAEKPPTRSTNLLIAVVAALFQLAAGWAFSGVGKVHSSHAQASARRLMVHGARLAAVKKRAEAAYEAEPKLNQTQLRLEMGQLSALLSGLEEDAVGSLDDWRLAHPPAVERAERQEPR